MKKKGKEKKQQDMPEISFKQFTPDEGRIYEEAVHSYRSAVQAGKKLKEAYDGYAIADAELRSVIQADFLKIMIAERHFAGREPLEKVASDLGVSPDLVKDTYGRMLQEVGVSTANQFGRELGDLSSKAND